MKKQLENAFVVAHFEKRSERIVQQIQHLARSKQAVAIIPNELLEEVTAIVEWPIALLGEFDSSFLEVPSQVLIASMQNHQKCFALCDKKGSLLPYFITIANINSKESQKVIKGNEKVIRARLSDAAFFYQRDKKQSLLSRYQQTEKVIFQDKLGSLAEKSKRMGAILR